MRHTQLKAFHHVAICGGFSRAADVLGLTQPAVSEQVRKLEEHYDVLLFDRRRKRVSLTERGTHLLAITRRLFEAEADAGAFLAETLALSHGTLRIIADSAFHVLPALGRFRAQYPRVQVTLATGNSADVLARLQAYEADIGVLGAIPETSDVDVLHLGASPLIAFAARGHPFAERETVTLAELEAAPLVMREMGSKTRQGIERAFAEADLTPAIDLVATGREAVRELVAAGAGIGIVSEAEFGEDRRLVPIPISDCSEVMQEALVWLHARAEGPLIRAFRTVASTGR